MKNTHALNYNRSAFQRLSAVCLVTLVCLFSYTWINAAGIESISFARQIRPILSDACFQCHGPDANKRKAGLRLDEETYAKKQIDGVWIIKEGAPHESDFIDRIFTSDPDAIMPPPKSGKTLKEEEKALLKTWIEQGAPWEMHWSFEPLHRPIVPSVKDSEWPVNPIDFFILSKLEKEGIRPSLPANLNTLARRLHLDLTGLPPAVEVTRRFVDSEDPLDYERMVDSLLADKAYGEKLSTHWLDLVRYADTVGYHGDQPYTVWPYRDYVIDAFNSNMSFDRFTREQIAGDLLPNATRTQKVASGFNRLHMITAEGGAQDREYLAKYAADRVRTTAGVWLGATMGCAECHDHKYDPYTMKDFYSLAAFFGDLKEKGFYGGSVWEPEMPLPSNSQEQEQDQLLTRVDSLEKQLTTPTKELTQAQSAWETLIQDLASQGRLTWIPIQPVEIASENGTEWIQQADLSTLTRGPNPAQETFTVQWEPGQEEAITGLRVEALTHPSMDKMSLSRGGGNFVLSETILTVVRGEKEIPIKIEHAEADFAQNNFDARRVLDGNDETGWAVDGANKKENRQLLLTLQDAFNPQTSDTLKLRLKFTSKHKHHVIGRFRLTSTSVPDPALSETGLSDEIYGIVTKPSTDRTEDETAQLTKHFMERTPLLDEARTQLASAKRRLDTLKNEIPTMLVSMSVKPRVMRILPRGNWMDDSGDIVQPAIPDFLDSEGLNKEESPLSRMDLANWLVSDKNPLTARHFVNHLWKIYFGYGLARVMEDSGSQGTPPTHPELIDWLASEFIRSGWDVKHIVRLMVTSQTYRQTSTPSDWLMERDPYNRLYARQSRFRLDAEIIRDQALEVCGLLMDQVGGPSVKPYQPAGYYSQLNFPKRTYQHDTGSSQYRRGLYTHWQRTFLHPMLKAFDAPTREECTAQRPRSNTPLQSLNLLNDPSFVEAARTYAAEILTSGRGSDRERIRDAFEEVTLRPPSHKELQILEDLLNDMRDGYRTNPERGRDLVKVGLNSAGAQCPPDELGAWTSVTRALFNLHETITRY
jgi:hypothetical protein